MVESRKDGSLQELTESYTQDVSEWLRDKLQETTSQVVKLYLEALGVAASGNQTEAQRVVGRAGVLIGNVTKLGDVTLQIGSSLATIQQGGKTIESISRSSAESVVGDTLNQGVDLTPQAN